MITMPMIVNSAPTSRTVTAPQPKGRAGGFLRAATAAYARGMVMGMDSSDADGLRVCDDDPSSNKSFRPFRARGIDGPRVVQLRIHPRLPRRDFREQCLKNDRGARSVNGFHAQTRPSAEPVGPLRARETGGRSGARTDPSRPHARPRGSRQPSARFPRCLLPGGKQRDRDEQGAPPSDPGDEPRPLQAVRLLRPPARVSPLPRIRGRARLPGAVPSDPRDLVRRGRCCDPDLRGRDAVLPEPCLPGCRGGVVGSERRLRGGFRRRIRVVRRVTTWRGSVRERRITAPCDAALGSPPRLPENVSVVTGILVAAILTFFLVTVVYGTRIDPKGTFNAVGGFAIGLTISIDIMMGGPLTGAAMNPARWFGPAVVAQFFDNWYVYWIGPFLGAIVAGLLYSRAFLDKTR